MSSRAEGQAGRTKITQHAVPHARPGDPAGHGHRGAHAPVAAEYYDDGMMTMLIMVITMTAGTAVIMWFGELITDRGIGNGMSRS